MLTVTSTTVSSSKTAPTDTASTSTPMAKNMRVNGRTTNKRVKARSYWRMAQSM